MLAAQGWRRDHVDKQRADLLTGQRRCRHAQQPDAASTCCPSFFWLVGPIGRFGACARARFLIVQSSRQQVEVSLEYDEGEPVGVYIDSNLVVTRITPGSPADGKITVICCRWARTHAHAQVGDKVMSVRGFPVRDQKEFYMKLMRAFPVCPMKVERWATADGRAVSLGPSTSSVTEDAKMTTLEPELHYGEPLGIVTDETLEVVFVQVGSCFPSPAPLSQENTPGAKLFRVGDIVRQVNGTNVIDVNHFHTLIDEAAAKIAKLIIDVDRSSYREAVVEYERLSEVAEKLVTRHHGFHYALVNVINDGIRPFGLLFANLAHNKVIVLGVKPGSVTADVLKVCAHPRVYQWPPALL